MSRPHPAILALFQKRIEGDDALLELAGLRFKEAGLGAEFYASTPDELAALLGFLKSAENPPVVHLSRDINILNEGFRALISDFAGRFRGRIAGMVVHDQPEIATNLDDYMVAVRDMGRRLERIKGGPFLFIEYAVCLDAGVFLELFRRIKDIGRISACVDIGHIGIKQARDSYSIKHPGEDVCAINPNDPRLPALIGDIQDAAASALPAVLNVIKGLGKLKKPVHFHLHDGHPLSTFSPFGVSDHLSFMQEMPIPFEYHGSRSVPLMYGPSGLSKIVKTALESIGPELVTFTLEIHPVEGRAPLGNAGHLFNHWQVKTNAERTEFWLDVLLQNQRLLLEALS